MGPKILIIFYVIILEVTSGKTGSRLQEKKFLLDGLDNSCDFNANALCSWINVNGGDDFDWTLHSGSTPTDDTGPSIDHTLQSDKGTYVFIESSAPRVQDEKAWLESLEIKGLGQSVVCFRFWYHKFGERMGNLSVYQHHNGPWPGNLVWRDVTDHGDQWQPAQVPLLANQNFKIILEGVIGDGYLGDIAVDDISVGNGYCVVTPPEASWTNVTPPPATTLPTPADGSWSAWSTWSQCSVTCGGGYQSRTRSCDFPPGVPHGAGCQGFSTGNRTCHTEHCPVDGVWTLWSAWSACPVTCGGGTLSRNRTCYFQPGVPHGNACTGQGTDSRTCNTNICAVDGRWSVWLTWSTCPVSCGGGNHVRRRTCIFDPNAPHGYPCGGSSTELQTCNTGQCPVDGVWSDWSPWSTCSITCGDGTRSRGRKCEYSTQNAPHGTPCAGRMTGAELCKLSICPESNECHFCGDNSTQGFVTNTSHCITDTACESDKVCYAENYYRVVSAPGYRYGCFDLQLCQTLMRAIFSYLDKCFGHFGDPGYPQCGHENQGTCSVCCGGGGCNNDTCRNIRDRLYLDYKANRLNMTSLRVL